MWFFSADLHLGHSNIIKYCNRPFMTKEEEGLFALAKKGVIPERDLRISRQSVDLMTNTIIDNINNVVGPDDHFVIIGDFCWTPKIDRYHASKSFRDRINCRNVYLIWGNHDDRVLSNFFSMCYDQYLFNVDHQPIFASHYPCRSWDRAYHGSWMLYGHVHDALGPEDNGKLMPYDEFVLREGFSSVAARLLDDKDKSDQLVNELISVCASLKGIDYTLDVGVDNNIRGAQVPFGTPWSMNEIRNYMAAKKARWELRKSHLHE